MVKFSALYKMLESNGWVQTKGKKHYKYVHPDFDFFIPVGRPPSHEVPSDMLKSILKQAKI